MNNKHLFQLTWSPCFRSRYHEEEEGEEEEEEEEEGEEEKKKKISENVFVLSKDNIIPKNNK